MKDTTDHFLKINIPLAAIGGIFTEIIAYYLAGTLKKGNTLIQWFDELDYVIHNPVKNYLNEYSVWIMVGAFFVYVLAVLYKASFNRTYMAGKEFGTSGWANPRYLNKKLADKSKDISDPLNIVVFKEEQKRK